MSSGEMYHSNFRSRLFDRKIIYRNYNLLSCGYQRLIEICKGNWIQSPGVICNIFSEKN